MRGGGGEVGERGGEEYGAVDEREEEVGRDEEQGKEGRRKGEKEEDQDEGALSSFLLWGTPCAV